LGPRTELFLNVWAVDEVHKLNIALFCVDITVDVWAVEVECGPHFLASLPQDPGHSLAATFRRFLKSRLRRMTADSHFEGDLSCLVWLSWNSETVSTLS